MVGVADRNRAWLPGWCLFIARWSGAQPGIWSRLTWPGVATRRASPTLPALLYGRAAVLPAPGPGDSPEAHPARPRSSSVIAGRDRCWPRRAPSSVRSGVTSSLTLACRCRGRPGWKPCRPISGPRCGEMAMPEGWLPPWPQWWGDEALAGFNDPAVAAALRPRLPAAAAGYVRGSSPPAAVARCSRRLPAAERGIPGPGGQGAGTGLARDGADEPPPRAAQQSPAGSPDRCAS